MRKFNIILKEESGAAMVITAVCMVVLLSFTALCVDMGLIYYQRSKLRTALDSAALAAVYYLPDRDTATQTAKEYLEKNGFSSDTLSVVFNEASTKIKLSDSVKMQTMFANVFNVSSVTNSASSSAKMEKRKFIEAFDYRILQASNVPTDTLALGAVYHIEGSVHSNANITSSPSHGGGYITGNLQAVGGVNAYTPNITTLGGIVTGADEITMPDFTGVVNEIVPDDWDFVGTAAQLYKYLGVNSWDSTIYVNGNVKIIGDISTSNWVINGNLFIDGNANMGWAKITLDQGSIYCAGNLTFNNSFYGNGCVFANGNINFNGGMSQLTTDTSTITVYSKTGNIKMSASGTSIHGIVYAPNGDINIAGNTLTYYGSLVAKHVKGIPATLYMYDLDRELPFEMSKKVAALVE